MTHATCLCVIDLPADGAWNMAVDEALLEWAAGRGGPVWRFYRWSEPTLSLGYFQQAEERQTHTASRLCPIVRRLSGGGTILHDDELTYSLVAPGDHPLALKRAELYQAVHAALIDALGRWGIAAARFAAEGPSGGPAAGDAFLCFQRRSPGDVIFGGMKIGGSAQRRRDGAILQHGSVLLGRSEVAPELPGICELSGVRIEPEALCDAWLPHLAKRLELQWIHGGLPPEVHARAEQLVKQRYADPLWTESRKRL